MEAPARYFVEFDVPAGGWESLLQLGARARVAAADLAREGRHVRILRSFVVPERGACFVLYESESAEAVREAASRVGQDHRPVSRMERPWQP